MTKMITDLIIEENLVKGIVVDLSQQSPKAIRDSQIGYRVEYEPKEKSFCIPMWKLSKERLDELIQATETDDIPSWLEFKIRNT